MTLYDVLYDRMAQFNPRLAVGDTTTVSFTTSIPSCGEFRICIGSVKSPEAGTVRVCAFTSFRGCRSYLLLIRLFQQPLAVV